MKSEQVMSVYPKIEFSLTVLLGHCHTVFYFIFATAKAWFWRGKAL